MKKFSRNHKGYDKKTPYIKVKDVPSALSVNADRGSFVDLSAIKISAYGKKGDSSITLSSETGSFDADSTKKVQVTIAADGSITLIGSIKDIDSFLNDRTAITYAPDEATPNGRADKFSLTTASAGKVATLAEITARVPVVEAQPEPVVEVQPVPAAITGTAADDVLIGADGDDSIVGLEGDDTLDGRGGNDNITGNAGNDVIRGGSGADILNGGAGEDTLQYEGSISGVTVDLNVDGAGFQSATGGDATGDIVSGFENVYATELADTLIGNAGDNVLFGYGDVDYIDGGSGDDVIRGGRGADVLIGGVGNDWLRYLGSTSGVAVNLTLNAAGLHQTSGGDAEGDTASGFENVYGSDFADMITGDAGNNYLIGYAGDDTIDGGAGDDDIRGGAGADHLDGGLGTDTLQYEDTSAGVTVDLNLNGTGIAQTSAGDASGDIIAGFENLTGSIFGDTLTGDSGRNIIMGLDGDDVINGGGGNDVIRGGAGADVLIGGAGSDVLQYAGSDAGVTVNLTLGADGLQQASGGDAQGDVISEFENVYGSSFGDTVTGNASRNILYGYAGDDSLDGGLGNDVLRGSEGADSFVFSTALGASNIDSITDFNSADDTIMLSSAMFSGLTAGELGAAQFQMNATGVADSADQRIVYDSNTGALYFDGDGNGAGAGVQFATLTAGLTLDQSDFFIF